jgi:tetratricopeptide (TPR) repeat protein
VAVIRHIALVLALAAISKADQPTKHVPPPEAVEHYKAGDAAYTSGDFKRAIDEFRSAYAIDPAPLLLFNIAQAYRLDGQSERALFLYRQYLAKDTRGIKKREADEKIAELEQLLKRQQETKAAPPIGTANPSDEPTPKQIAPAPPPTTPQASPALVASSPAPEKGMSRRTKVAIAVSVTVGVVAIALGIGLGVGLQDHYFKGSLQGIQY